MTVWLPAVLLTLCATTYVYRTVRAKQIEETLVRLHSYEAPKKLDIGKWPLGLELVIKAFQVAREQRLLRFMHELVLTTGWTFEQVLLGTRGIDTMDPINVEALLSKQFTDFGLGERRLVFAPLLGDGIFTQDGKAWERSRALLRPAFHRREHSLVQIEQATASLISHIPKGVAVDLQPLFFRFTMETTSHLLFGHALEELGLGTSEKATSFADSFDKGQDYLARRGRLGGLYWLIDGFDFRHHCRRVHKYLDKAIEEALRRSSIGGKQQTYSVLGALVEQTKDRKVLREQCLNVLLAGRDTTACLLTWVFRLLARHPHVFRRCREEILETFDVHGQITREKLKRMKYVDAILKEVLRLYPSVPVNSRLANKTTTLPTGGGPHGKAPVLVRKGEAVGYCPYVMHRREDIFGSDAAIFRPERWLENGGRLVSTVGCGYVPFNAGPRICLGQEFALLEAGYAVTRIIQVFPSLALPPNEPPIAIGDERQKLTLVLACADGCNVVLS